MTDPHQVAGIVTGAGLSSIGLVLGAQVDALVMGLIAAVFISIWLPSVDSKLKASSAVLFSALLAALASSFAAEWVSASVPAFASNADSLRLLMALLIGGGAPRFVPLSIDWAQRKFGGQP